MEIGPAQRPEELDCSVPGNRGGPLSAAGWRFFRICGLARIVDHESFWDSPSAGKEKSEKSSGRVLAYSINSGIFSDGTFFQ